MALKAFFKPSTTAPIVKKRASRRAPGAGGCEACGLWKDCKSPKMEATGLGEKGILVIAEAPGGDEDEKGIQLIGKSGKLLRRELERIGIDLDRDCRKINAINCRPPGNRTPKDQEVAYCRQRVQAEIESFQPEIILALGGSAMKSLAQHRTTWEYGFPGIMNWQGEMIPDQDLGAWVIPTWHPAFILRQDGHRVFERKWRQDLKRIATALQLGPPPAVDYEAGVEVIVSPALAAKRLEELFKYLLTTPDPHIAFDYETTGRKPYAEGHKIVCASVSWARDKAIAFLLTPDTWPWLYKILRHPKIKKSAHNMKFEEVWSRVRGWPENGGFEVNGWDWDSMLAAFVLDNRRGKSGLKYQSYAKLGVLGYNNVIADYLKADDDDNANAFNRVLEAPIRELLLYCGMDSILEFNIAFDQKPQIEADAGLSEAYTLWHEGCLCFADAEQRGIMMDVEYCNTQSAHIDRRVQHLEKKLLSYPEVQKWKKMAENKGKKFNLNSKQQLQALLFTKEGLGLKPTKETASGAASVDKDVLELLDLSFVQDYQQIQKLKKLNGTYLKGFVNESPGGILHPFFNLNTVVSYRGSCDSPNFQNIPKRDPESQRLTRRALYPHDGYLWLEIDYSSIEVRIAATYHQDPVMMQYLNDPHSDMHRDMAMQLMFIPENLVSKYLRNAAKNGFVFAQFYGDWYEACARNMWLKWFRSPAATLTDGTHIYDHLRSHGIKDMEDFIDHVKTVENHFWNKRFKVYGQWREDNWEEYLRTGYMRAHTGFIYNAIMDRKQTSNYGTQGCGFHCLVWSMTRANERLKQEQWLSFLNGQIHDAIEGNAHPKEVNALIPMMHTIMVDDLLKRFQWINVPMDIEVELAPLGKSWYELKQVHKRPLSCSCGLDWGYQKKLETGTQWECPVCAVKTTLVES